MDWEFTKENCVPIRAGRSKAALQELADPAQEALETKRRELWVDVTNYIGDDPLEPWQRYIKWMQEYGVGGGKTDLMKVLEACTRELLKYSRYTNDIRFLRIWIQYADCLADPDDVFLFLKEKGIGREFALYYEAYATYFELKGNFKGADAVYMDGIQRGVKQLERLKQKHVAFQQRMAQRIQRWIQNEQVMGPPPEEPVRANLATIGLRSSGRGANVRQQDQQQQSAAGILGIATVPTQQGMHPRRPDPVPHELGLRPVINLYKDEEFLCDENPGPGLPAYSLMPQATTSSRELQPYVVRRKENLNCAMAWNQAPLLPGVSASAVGAQSSAAGGLQIFTDEEFQEGDDELSSRAAGARPLINRVGTSAAQSLLLPGVDKSMGAASTGVDALMLSLAPPPRTLLGGAPSGPTHSVLESIAALSISGLTAASTQQRQVPSGGAGPTQPVEAASYGGDLPARPSVQPHSYAKAGPSAAAECKQGGRDDDGDVSYEELRAVAWLQRNSVLQDGASTLEQSLGPSGHGTGKVGPSSNCLPTSSEPGQVTLSSQIQIPPTSNQSVMIGSQEDEYSTAPAGTGAANALSREPSASASNVPRCTPFRKVSPAAATDPPELPVQNQQSCSYTAVEEHLLAAPRGSAQRQPLADSAPSTRGPLGQTVADLADFGLPSTQRLGLEPDPQQMTSQPLPAAAALANSGFARKCDRKQDDSHSTVTISTRGAFDLMNSLFSEDLPHQQSHADREQSRSVSSRTAEPLPPVAAARPPLVAAEARKDVRMSWPQPQTAPQTAELLARKQQQTTTEPTVTLNTKLAFDALNDMFCDTLPHEEARKVTRRGASVDGGVTHVMPITTSDVCRLANAARNSLVMAAGPCASRRDTPYGGSGSNGGIGTGGIGGGLGLNAPVAHGFAAGPSVAIHEGTFLAPTILPNDRMPRGRDSNRAAPPMSHAQHFADREMNAMYEDTEFIPEGGGLKRSAASANGPFILEDTDFVTRHPVAQMAPLLHGGCDMAARVSARSDGGAAGALDRNAAVDLRTPKFVDALQQRYSSKGPLQVYEDTQYGNSRAF